MTTNTGRFGFPLVESLYTICSDVYGHIINVPLDTSPNEAFLDAVEVGYANGKLHDNGHLVVDESTGTLAFLVTVRLSDDTFIPAQKLSELSALYGVKVCVMEVLDNGRLPGYQVVTAQLNWIEQFDIAYDLAADIVAAEEKNILMVLPSI